MNETINYYNSGKGNSEFRKWFEEVVSNQV